jgi:hypothetical protein
MPSVSGHTPATPSTVALQRRHQPAKILQLGVVAYCPAIVLKSCRKAAADPVGFAFDITAYFFSWYVASFILKIAVNFAKGTVANLTEA